MTKLLQIYNVSMNISMFLNIVNDEQQSKRGDLEILICDYVPQDPEAELL